MDLCMLPPAFFFEKSTSADEVLHIDPLHIRQVRVRVRQELALPNELIMFYVYFAPFADVCSVPAHLFTTCLAGVAPVGPPGRSSATCRCSW